MDITIISVIMGFLVNTIVVGVAWGRMAQRIEDHGKQLNLMYNELHNGFTCKSHASITETLGKLQGQLQNKK